jgi:tetratricopeptide (TPR) repeat protein
MEEGSRRYNHDRIARRASKRQAPDDFRTTLEVSHHLIRAGALDKAVTTVERGTAVAIARGAPREAEKALRNTIAAVPGATQNLRVLLAQALDAQGKFRETLEAIGGYAVSRNNRTELAAVAILRARALRLSRLASQHEIISAGNRAVATARFSRDAEALARALQVQAEIASDYGDLSTLGYAATVSSRLRKRAIEPRVRALCDLTRGFSLLLTGELIQAREAFTRSERLFGPDSFDRERLRALNGIGMSSTGLADFATATDAFASAIRLADHIGDSLMAAALWGNLATSYEYFGFFQEAATCTATAVEAGERSNESRAKAMAYARAASLAISLGNRAQTESLVVKAESTASVVGIPTYEAEAMVIKAEYLITCDEHELAWPLVERATETARRGGSASTEVMGLERLRRHRILATQGYEEFQSISNACPTKHLVEELELRTFGEWAAQKEGLPLQNIAFNELVERGLLGPIARLRALKICPGDWETRKEESSAQQVLRLFRHRKRREVSLGILMDQ